MAKEFGIMEKTTFTSFHFDYVAKLKALDKSARIGWLTETADDEAVEKLLAIGGEEIAPKAALMTREDVARWRAAGLGVRAWGVENEIIMKQIFNSGISGMTVNFPDKLTEYYSQAK